MQKVENINETPHDGKPLLCAAFFQKYGFSKPIRYWNEKWQQFSIYYKIEGYDCDILVRPSTQVVPNNLDAFGKGVHEMPPEIQVDEFSDIEMLEDHHTGDFQIFVNSFENHVATFNYQCQMLDFMLICGCPLSST
jgi:hypothetical protein